MCPSLGQSAVRLFPQSGCSHPPPCHSSCFLQAVLSAPSCCPCPDSRLISSHLGPKVPCEVLAGETHRTCEPIHLFAVISSNPAESQRPGQWTTIPPILTPTPRYQHRHHLLRQASIHVQQRASFFHHLLWHLLSALICF